MEYEQAEVPSVAAMILAIAVVLLAVASATAVLGLGLVLEDTEAGFEPSNEVKSGTPLVHDDGSTGNESGDPTTLVIDTGSA